MGGVQSKKITKKLENREIEKINNLFKDISVVVKGTKVVDRDGFRRFHMIPGPLADRLFNMFDNQKKTGMLTLDDFTSALAVCGKAPEKEKIALIFKFIDLDDDEIITKEEIAVLSVVSLEANSPKATEGEEAPKPIKKEDTSENPLIKQVVDMGFTKLKAIQAIKATENGTKGGGSSPMDNITNWILNNSAKEDEIDIDEGEKEVPKSPESQPISPATAAAIANISSPGKADLKALDGLAIAIALSGILSTFEALFAVLDGKDKITLKSFKKWATSSKRPPELDSLIKPIAGLYDRALKWKQDGLNSSTGDLNSSTDSNPRTLNRSSSNISQSNLPPVAPADIGTGRGTVVDRKKVSGEMANPKDLKRSVSVIEPRKKDDKKKEDEKKEDNSGFRKPPIKDDKKEENGKKKKQTDQPTTTTTTVPPTNASTTDISKHSQLASSTSSFDSDGFTDSDDEHSIKPAIQVVIKDKPVENVELKKTNSLFNIDTNTPGIVKPMGSLTLRTRGNRASMAPRPASSIFDGSDYFNQPLTPVTALPTKPPTVKQLQTSNNGLANSNDTLSPTKVGSPRDLSSKNNNQIALELIKECIQYLEAGQFQETTIYLDKCIQLMISNTQNPQSIQNEIIYIVGYKLLVSLLTTITKLDTQLQQSQGNEDTKTDLLEKLALQSKIMVGIPSQPQHKILFARLAIRYNFEAQNYGVTHCIIDNLLASYAIHLDQPTKTSLNQMLQECVSQKDANFNLPMYLCPQCKESTASRMTNCTCGHPIRFCTLNHTLIQDLTILCCDFCNSTYSINQTDVIPTSTCPSCNHGTIYQHTNY